MPSKKSNTSRTEPRNVKPETRRAVLLEAGYNCVNPTCRVPLIHVHHIVYVENGGPDSEDNLVVLCPNCHGRVHAGLIPDEAVKTWKRMVVVANHAWAKETLNALLFLDTELGRTLFLTGDGVVRFVDLLVSGLAEARQIDWIGDKANVVSIPYSGSWAIPASELTKSAFRVCLSSAGHRLVAAWKQGDLTQLADALASARPSAA